MKRAGFDTGWDASDFHKNWGGGGWQDRLGLGSGERVSVDDFQSAVHQTGFSQEGFATNYGGGNWLKKKFGMGQFDKKVVEEEQIQVMNQHQQLLIQQHQKMIIQMSK